ncbi:MAG: hypothetical protein WED34_18310 [Planctomycetales bacterium]
MEERGRSTVLDHFDGIVVPGDVFSKPANEFWALVCLWSGMEYLYRQCVKCDETVRQRLNPDGKFMISGFGNLPGTEDVPKALLTCAFHWYAISACQYVRTVGAIAHRHDSDRPRPREYVDSVIPEVVAFRDKVAAHFAWTTENKKDNEAERAASVLPPLAFVNDAYHVGANVLHVRRAGKSSDSKSISPWSLSRVHERLRQRYWPEAASSEERSSTPAD